MNTDRSSGRLPPRRNWRCGTPDVQRAIRVSGSQRVEKLGSYPTRDEHAHRWEQLCRDIAASRRHLRESAATQPGTLIVLGSGIEGLSFVMGAEAYLRMADKVFYCVSDAPTQVWLQTLRPDAYDLYVLYDDTKPRYSTYIQMSEAILHYVREGLRVVVVYYGHPGIFVFSTHRSIAIARREGHYAVMKAGISALDCLCADLGVDPAFPGLQTFEATDVLLRRRTLDTAMHVVLWQVGLVGDGGYRRQGFINDKFPLLVEYLERFYGPDHEVTHYIAARHAAFEPTIAVHRFGRLADPRVRATLTGFSTLYIPPKHGTPTDPEMALRLGLIQPGQKPVDQPALRPIASYGKFERAALEELERFHVPDAYHFQERTRAAEFLIDLGQNVALQDLYRESPAQAVAEESFPGLSAHERQLLAQRDEGWAMLAARGARASTSPNEQFVLDLHERRELASGFRAALASAVRGTDVAAAVDAWIASQGYRAALAHVPAASQRVNASTLLPWTGVYATADGSVVVTVVGSPGLVYVGTVPLTRFTFHDATLAWEAADGNPHHGRLTFRMPALNGTSAFVRTASGTLGAEQVIVSEAVAASTALTMWTGGDSTPFEGRYRVWSWSGGQWIPRGDFDYAGTTVQVDAQTFEGAVFERNVLQWPGGRVHFFIDPATQSPKFIGDHLFGIRSLESMPSSRPAGDGIPPRVWETLAAIGLRTTDPSYHLLWSRWPRARFTCRLLNNLVPRVCEVVSTAKGEEQS
ncbi:MAG TPA: SAM-dependent methyltransferase [Thermoanaerobaculia bacterium]|nr:SAM-dependent methyltransferase [Thermoanaerobaculia bacterium]